MKTYGIGLYRLMYSTGQLHASAALPPGKDRRRLGLDDLEKRKILPLPGFELLPCAGQSPYVLSYPWSLTVLAVIAALLYQ
jgi:hypothetical protein